MSDQIIPKKGRKKSDNASYFNKLKYAFAFKELYNICISCSLIKKKTFQKNLSKSEKKY